MGIREDLLKEFEKHKWKRSDEDDDYNYDFEDITWKPEEAKTIDEVKEFTIIEFVSGYRFLKYKRG